MSESNSTSSGGLSFTGLLALIFITLKLTGHITWPWVWVLAPIWIPIVIAATILLAVAIWSHWNN